VPIYTYRCSWCGNEFDKRAAYADKRWPCSCGAKARRVPFYGGQELKLKEAETPRSEVEERRWKGIKQLFTQGWDYSRALEHLHNHIVETPIGKGVDMRRG